VARTARVVSQNVGPLGLRHVIPIIQKMIMTQRPSVIFLQDCKLKETDANSIANLRQAFPSTVYLSAAAVGRRRDGCISRRGRLDTIVTAWSRWCTKAVAGRPSFSQNRLAARALRHAGSENGRRGDITSSCSATNTARFSVQDGKYHPSLHSHTPL